MSQPTLVLVCKRPAPGQGKQRLAAVLGAERALALAEGFLACALEDARAWQGPVVIAPAHSSDLGWARSLAGDWAQVLAQPPGNLGQRLQELDRVLRQRGHRRILFMGSDSPTLTAAHFASARSLLERQDVALCRAEDGGVVLMGSARPWPELAGLPWSESSLCESLASACRQAGYRIGFGEPGYDVDRACDLSKLHGDLHADRRPARRQLLKVLASPGDTGDRRRDTGATPAAVSAKPGLSGATVAHRPVTR